MPTRRKWLYTCLNCGFRAVRYSFKYLSLCPDCGLTLHIELVYQSPQIRKVVVK